MKLKLIVNPYAASGRKIKFIDRIKSRFMEGGFDVHTYISRSPQGVYNCVKKSKNKFDVIVVAGGDGTINKVVNVLAGSKCKFGFIPLGSANCIADGFKIPTNIEEACNVIIKGKTKMVDLGILNGTYFLGFASFGFDAGICYDFQESQKIKNLSLGRRALVVPLYVIYGFKRFFATPSIKMSVRSKKKELCTGYWILIGNIKKYPGDWLVFPKAKVDDGLLDLSVGRKGDFFNNFKYFLTTRKGKHIGLSNVFYSHVKEIEITADQPVMIQIDGEYLGTTPARIKVVPKALNLIVP